MDATMRNENRLLLSSFDDNLLALVLSESGVKELGRLALVGARRLSAKSFGGPDSDERWSIIGEAARIKAERFPDALKQLAPRGSCWLRRTASLASLAEPVVIRSYTRSVRTGAHVRPELLPAEPPAPTFLHDGVAIDVTIFDLLSARETELSVSCEAPAVPFGQQYVEVEVAFSVADLPEHCYFSSKVDIGLAPARNDSTDDQLANAGFQLHLAGESYDEWGNVSEPGILSHTPAKGSLWADHGCSDGEWGQWSESYSEDGEAEYKESIWLPGEGSDAYGRDTSAWPALKHGDKVGLLWDADEGNLTVFLNGHRKGFANGQRWMGEIKGNFCWHASITSFFVDGDDLDEAAATFSTENSPSAKVTIRHCPPVLMTTAERRAERKQLAEMAKLKTEREAEVADLLDKKENPRCPGCQRVYR